MATPSVAVEEQASDDIAKTFFDALPATKEERNESVIGCANALCSAKQTISEDSLNAVVNAGENADEIVRRLQFGVRILSEYNLTDTLDESMIVRGRQELRDYTRYLPLVGSFNQLCETACTIETPNPSSKTLTDFLYATLAFGIEVGLWTIGAPYKMAWSGTRFIANRTFLRFARYGCRGCIALAMSELHWAIRASVYGHGITESRVKFVGDRIQELDNEAEELNYDVDLDFSEEAIQERVEPNGSGAGGIFPQENEGYIDRLIPDVSIDIPSIPELLEQGSS